MKISNQNATPEPLLVVTKPSRNCLNPLYSLAEHKGSHTSQTKESVLQVAAIVFDVFLQYSWYTSTGVQKGGEKIQMPYLILNPNSHALIILHFMCQIINFSWKNCQHRSRWFGINSGVVFVFPCQFLLFPSDRRRLQSENPLSWVFFSVLLTLFLLINNRIK